ncbi:IVa2 [Frog adenovirus 1]|uniref:IVa2 n=1 Tax=Frog adenovirus 1 (strain ATCC VR-896) TaxID=114102 RepID=Q9III4_ADEF1|nr:IVa2 [Frog adenovirus 1]AAF86923.1 IVa2 [Frog adenovirus 1]
MDKRIEEFYNKIVEWKNAVDRINRSILPECDLPPYRDFYSYEIDCGLEEYMNHFYGIQKLNQKFLSANGELSSLNYGLNPFIGIISGPTGTGKSQLIRNLISNKLISPPPETVIFITPTKGMLSPEETNLWKLQLQEGNYEKNTDGICPITSVFSVDFVEIDFETAVSPDNLDINNDKSCFVQAAKNGNVCIVIDECMKCLIDKRNISPLFCSLPSKISSKFKTGFSMFVVLHNINPTSGNGNNIMDLKIQAKLHILSSKNAPFQLSRFVNTYGTGMSPQLKAVLMNSIIEESKNDYSFILFNVEPPRPGFSWCALLNGGNCCEPLSLDLQSILLECVNKICAILKCKKRNRERYVKEKKRKLELDN